MEREMTLHATDPDCARAVMLFAERVAAVTGLRPRVAVSAEEDVVFAPDAEGSKIAVTWEAEGSEDGEEPDDGEPGADGGAYEFYGATMQALARNRFAARALLERAEAKGAGRGRGGR